MMVGIPIIESYQMPTTQEIPVNIVNWKINIKRAVLLIHDMQEYFLNKITAENLRLSLLHNAGLIREYCIQHEVPIAYTTQPGGMTTSQRGLLKDFWGPGMKVDPSDKRVVKELRPRDNDWILTKWRYSAFFQTDLLERMQSSGRDQLIICGVYGHIGILTTAVEAFSHDIETFIIADCIADFSLSHHLATLNHAASCCASILLTQQVLV